MAKLQTLADFFETGRVEPDAAAVQPDDEARFAKLSGEEFAEAVLNSSVFRNYILNGYTLGTLPAVITIRLMDYVKHWGKPVERVEVKDTSVPVEQMTADYLEQRASRLLEMSRFLRRAEQFAEPLSSDSVH